MRLILQVFYCLFSACLLSLAIPNELLSFGSPFIAFVALCPYYIAIKNCKSYREAFWLGFIQKGAVHLMSSFWLAFFKDFAIFTLGASAIGTACIGGAFGLLFYLPYYSEPRKNELNLSSMKSINTVQSRIVYFAAVYTFYEWVKTTGFLGYPWGTISSCMFNAHALMQLSAITGTYGITFLTVYFSALISEGFTLIPVFQKSPSKRRILSSYKQAAGLWIILFSAAMIYGFIEYNKTRTPYKILTCILVQQNEDPWTQISDQASITLSQELTSKKIEELKAEGKKPDLIIWSEGVLKSVYPNAEKHYANFPAQNPLKKFIRDSNTPLLTGGSYVKETNGARFFYNAAHVFDEKGNYRGYYAKNHLVPFAEAIPFAEYPAVRNFLRKVVRITAGWTPGNQYTYFDIPCKYYSEPDVQKVRAIDLLEPYDEQMRKENQPPVTRISLPVCFDDAFTDVCRPLYNNGSEVFINLTDDSWSQKNSSEIQHFVIASYRAIEYRTTLVRSTNAGVTSVVDPAGNVLASLPLFEETSMAYDVPVYKRKMTVYAKFGNWFPYMLGILIGLYFIWNLLTFKPSDYIPSERKIKKSKKHNKKNDKKKHHHN